MFCFLEIDITEQQKYEKRIQTFVDNTGNDLGYEIKFENSVRDKNKFCNKRKIFFFKQKYTFLFLETYFFKISKNLIASAFFLLRQILKNIDMPRQKPRHLPTAEANFERSFNIKTFPYGVNTTFLKK